MKPSFLLLLLLAASLMLTQTVYAQSTANCYQTVLTKAKASYADENYADALKKFTAAKGCPDLPPNNELNAWIAKCQKAMKPTSVTPPPAPPKPSGPKDSDGDGLVDSKDQCPNTYGEPSNNGCPKATPARSFASYTESGISPGMRMIAIPAGSFDMGCTSEQQDCSDDEKPVHRVTLSGFYICETEVTQAQWRAVMGSNPSQFSGCDNCPVENVSWDDVQTYISRLNVQCGRTYRLPTEAEWQYAALGGQSYLYAGSNSIDNVAWYTSNSGDKTHTVKGKSSNGYGLYDMSGNVSEWCSDWYGEGYYANSPSNNPKGPSTGTFRVHRGGDWAYFSGRCRVVDRRCDRPSDLSGGLGFRLVSSSL